MIRKAVIPAAGLGTRFLPFTRAVPKEMIPIVDTPVIQYVVEEAVASGLDDIIIVIGPGKESIRKHFSRLSKSEARRPALKSIQRILSRARVRFVEQREPRGLGHAVAQARAAVGDEPFAVLLGDVITVSKPPLTRQLIRLFEKKNAPVVAIRKVASDVVSRYGIIGGPTEGANIFRIETIVEKPAPSEAPSNLAVASRYVLTPDIFKYLASLPAGLNGEIQITDALERMLADQPMYGLRFRGERYDIGAKADFLRANIAFAR